MDTPSASSNRKDLNQDQELAIAEMISDWLIQMSSEQQEEKKAAQTAYWQWKHDHPEYLYIAERLESCYSQISLIQQQHGKNKKAIGSLFRPKIQRKKSTTKYGVLLLAGFIPFVIYLQNNALRYWFADLRSGTGEWRTEMLVDGTQITLKNKTAINIQFNQHERVITLITGDILVKAAPNQSAPLTVVVDQGSIHALGTQFSVNYQPEYADLNILQSKVVVNSNAHDIQQNFTQSQVVHAGESVYLTRHGIQTMPKVNIQRIQHEWSNKQLVADDQPLSDVLQQLDQAHHGKIYFNQHKLDGIKVTAVIPLDDTSKAIKLLQAALPQLRIKTMGGYVYWIDLVQSKKQTAHKKN